MSQDGVSCCAANTSSFKRNASPVASWSYRSSELMKYAATVVIEDLIAAGNGGHWRDVQDNVPLFVPNCPDATWNVVVYGLRQPDDFSLTISVICSRSGSSPVWKKGAVSISARGILCLKEEYEPQPAGQGPDGMFREAIEYHLNMVLARQLIVQGRLTIRIEIYLEKDAVTVHATPDEHLEEHFDLVQDLKRMLKDETLTDTVVNVGGRRFAAHRNILAARSPGFAAMFESKPDKAKNWVLDINDSSPEVFQTLHQFIYTNEVPDVMEKPAEILAAADKYGLKKLKDCAQIQLSSHLAVEHVCDLLIVAETADALYLKCRALQFIAAHHVEVSKTSGWNSLMATYPTLAIEASLYFGPRQVT